MSHAVVVVIDPVHARLVEGVWDELEARFGLRAVRAVPFPHITLQVARDYREVDLVHALASVATRWTPFRVHARGYGIFTGDRDAGLALHLPVIRTPALSALQQDVWDALEDVTTGTEGLYEPEHWAPHITLADRDLSPDRLAEVVRWLATRPPRSWHVAVRELAVIHDGAPARELRHRTPLGEWQ